MAETEFDAPAQPGNILTSKTVALSTYTPLLIAGASFLSPDARAVVIGLLVDHLEGILALYAAIAFVVRRISKNSVALPTLTK